VGGVPRAVRPGAYRRSAFCQIYGLEKRLKRSMPAHFAGEKLFIDYAGRTVPIYERTVRKLPRAAVRGALAQAATRTPSHAQPGAAGLARQPCAGAGVLRRRANDLRSG